MAVKKKFVPWYRQKSYHGNLSEEEKRHLDAFYQLDQHPAVYHGDLPEEASRYINELECELHQERQDSAVTKFFAMIGIGLAVFYVTYNGLGWLGNIGYLVGAVIIVFALYQYYQAHSRNSDWFMPKYEGDNAPVSLTEEKLFEHWDLDEITRYRSRGRQDL